MEKSKTKKMHIFTKAFHKYKEIDSDRDLAKNHLTLAEYETVYDGLAELSRIRKGDKFQTFMSGVAKWFENNGFSVKLDNHGVNYIISLD